jgi:Uncharacterized conserved protein
MLLYLYLTITPASGYSTVILSSAHAHPALQDIFSHTLPRPDPNGILDFLTRSLQEAENAGHRVWIIGHMPPGGPDALRDQVKLFIFVQVFD